MPHASPAWPPLPYADWEPTKQTLHRYTQIAGKIRMALVPARNHWWHVTLYVTSRGLSTGPMPVGSDDLEIAFDFVDHRIRVLRSDGRVRELDLRARPACADVYAGLLAALDELDAHVEINPLPFDLGDSPSLAEDRVHDDYDADAVARYWHVLAGTQRVLDRLRSSFAGKASPVHLFWHSFDLAHARYSGRAVTLGDVDRITAEAYSHEVIAFGFWPGDARTTPYPAFYSYTAPEPAGLTDHPLVDGARWQQSGSGSLALLPYDSVRAADDPDAGLLRFYQAAYAASARAGNWDLDGLAARDSS